MQDFLNRFTLQVGNDAIHKLNNCHIALFGLGGVGSYCAEVLSRSGVGTMTIVDKDTVDLTNINRQLIALHSTINKDKVEVCRDRLLDINPQIKINAQKVNFSQDNVDFDFSQFDYVIDAIDDIKAKITLIKECKKVNTRIITCMGTGNKLNPMLFKVEDISQSHTCPLAKLVRKQLKELNISNVKCLFSTEKPIDTQQNNVISSNAFVPSVAGILLAREVVLDIIN